LGDKEGTLERKIHREQELKKVSEEEKRVAEIARKVKAQTEGTDPTAESNSSDWNELYKLVSGAPPP
jgi:hypothetical protein